MKKLSLIIGAAMALGAVSVTYAATFENASAKDNAVVGSTLPGFYLGLGAGYGQMNTPKLNAAEKATGTILGGQSESRRGLTGRGSLGYLWAFPQSQNVQLGAEVGYNYYPKSEYSLGNSSAAKFAWDYKSWSADLLAVAKYNFKETGFNIIGKVGPAYVKQRTTVTVTGTPLPGMIVPMTGSRSKNAVKPEAAIGVGYDINQNIGIDLVYSHIFGSKPANLNVNATNTTSVNDFTKIASLDTVLLNVTYHFGSVGGLV